MIKRILKSCLTLTRIWWKLVIILLVPLLYSPLLFVSGSDPAKAIYGIFIIGTYWVANVAPLAATALLPVFIFPLLKVGLPIYFDLSSILCEKLSYLS